MKKVTMYNCHLFLELIKKDFILCIQSKSLDEVLFSIP